MAHRPDDGELVGHLRQAGEQFTHLQSGNDRRDGLKWAADLGGGLGFQIETVDVTAAAVLHDKDARPLTLASLRFRLQELGQAESQCAEAAQLQKISSVEF